MYSDYQLDDFLNMNIDKVSFYFMYDRLNELVFNNRLPKCNVIWNNRLTATAGLAYEDNKIEISYKYHSKYPGELLDTMIHEMTHIALPDESHNDTWKAYINDLNSKFPILNLQQFTKYTYWKYLYSCECGNEWKRNRKYTNVKYHCTNCKSTLKLKYTCNHA